ncbi:dUTP diphosphatase [Hathewaya histolytica]|uniref:Dimeric dUTPase n=1 Tax=Hathewaya histolytica TaxID=1498 RepID=A0A4U9RUM2_HATHI|nr:dUTP diphosphatase [Hathewaya histolytica]VTQ96204.1 dimeric dUTPase [Hathewaya histolytica]
MDFKNLFSMQEMLDYRIEKEHGLLNENLIPKKALALFVELGELANETRCFKFWSSKGPSSKEVILEEYVDGLHFILSLGLKLNYSTKLNLQPMKTLETPVHVQFLDLYKEISHIDEDCSKELYESVFQNFLNLGSSLGFSEEDIESAYIDKNKVNHQRQDQGY